MSIHAEISNCDGNFVLKEDTVYIYIKDPYERATNKGRNSTSKIG